MKKKPQGRGGARDNAGRHSTGRRQVTYWMSDVTLTRLESISIKRIDQARVIEAAVGRLTDKQIKEMAESGDFCLDIFSL